MRTWHVLTACGLLGVASMMLAPLEHLVPIEAPALALRALALIQPALLTTLAGFLGGVSAPKVALEAPLVAAILTSGDVRGALRRQLPVALLAALAASAILALYNLEVAPELSRGSTFAAKFAAFEPPLLTKVLYGGLTEELLLRWGAMSVFAWALWRLSGRPNAIPVALYWLAIAVAAFLFAVAHLPVIFTVWGQPPLWIVGAVMIGNVVPGVLFGWLFWTRGVEAAMIAHGLTHVFATALTRLAGW